MRLVIRKGKTSRVLEAPFNLVGSRDDLRELVRQINEQVNDNFCYGTLYIVDRPLFGTPNTEPSPWEE
jgi:hypothetical protein